MFGQLVAAGLMLVAAAAFVGWWAWQYLGRSYLCVRDGVLVEYHRGQVKARVGLDEFVGFEVEAAKTGFPHDVFALHLKAIARARRRDGYSTAMWSLSAGSEDADRLEADIGRVTRLIEAARATP